MSDNRYTQAEHLNEMRRMETGQDEREPHQRDVHEAERRGALFYKAHVANFVVAEAHAALLREVEAWWTKNNFDKEWTCDHSVGVCFCEEQAMIARIRDAVRPEWKCWEAGCTEVAWHHMSDGHWCDVHLLLGARKQEEDGA